MIQSRYLPILLALTVGMAAIILFIHRNYFQGSQRQLAASTQTSADSRKDAAAYSEQGTEKKQEAASAGNKRDESTVAADNSSHDNAAMKKQVSSPAASVALGVGRDYDRDNYQLIDSRSSFATGGQNKTRVYAAARLVSRSITNIYFHFSGPRSIKTRSYKVGYNTAGYNIFVFRELVPGNWTVTVYDAAADNPLQTVSFSVEK